MSELRCSIVFGSRRFRVTRRLTYPRRAVSLSHPFVHALSGIPNNSTTTNTAITMAIARHARFALGPVSGAAPLGPNRNAPIGLPSDVRVPDSTSRSPSSSANADADINLRRVFVARASVGRSSRRLARERSSIGRARERPRRSTFDALRSAHRPRTRDNVHTHPSVLHALSARACRDSTRAEKDLSSPTSSRRSLRLDAELGDDAAGEDANSPRERLVARERGLGVRTGVSAADMSDVVGRGVWSILLLRRQKERCARRVYMCVRLRLCDNA